MAAHRMDHSSLMRARLGYKPLALIVHWSARVTCPPTGSTGMVMPPPVRLLTGTVADGQLAPPVAVHVALVDGTLQFWPALGVSVNTTLFAVNGPLFVTTRL